MIPPKKYIIKGFDEKEKLKAHLNNKYIIAKISLLPSKCEIIFVNV